MGRSNPWGDLDRMWLVGRYGGRNHVCNISWLSVKGCGCGERGKFAFSHWLDASPLQHWSHYRVTVWSECITCEAMQYLQAMCRIPWAIVTKFCVVEGFLIFPKSVITGRPPRSAAMPVLFLLSGPKNGFLPRRGDTLPRWTWNLARWSGPKVCSPTPNFTFIGAEMWEYSPKTVKISNFGHKFAPRLHNLYEILSVCTRLQVAFKFLIWSLSGNKQLSYRRQLVNAYEVEAGIGVIAGNTVWSMPERLECEVLQKARYINTLTFTLLSIFPRWEHFSSNFQ